MPKLLNSGTGQAQYIEYSDTLGAQRVTNGKIYFKLAIPSGQTLLQHMESVHTKLISALKGSSITLVDVSMDSGSTDKESFTLEFRCSTVLPIKTLLDALKTSKLADGGESAWQRRETIQR